jgi:hypothetical protein
MWFFKSSPFMLFILQHSLFCTFPTVSPTYIETEGFHVLSSMGYSSYFVSLYLAFDGKVLHYIDYLFLKYMLHKLIWFGHPFFHLLSSANGQISYAKAMLHHVLLHSRACILYSLFDLSPLLFVSSTVHDQSSTFLCYVCQP